MCMVTWRLAPADTMQESSPQSWKSGVSAEVIGLPDHSVGDALYRAKITISTPEVFAWTAVIVLLSATLSTLAAWALRRAKRALCGEVEG